MNFESQKRTRRNPRHAVFTFVKPSSHGEFLLYAGGRLRRPPPLHPLRHEEFPIISHKPSYVICCVSGFGTDVDLASTGDSLTDYDISIPIFWAAFANTLVHKGSWVPSGIVIPQAREL